MILGRIIKASDSHQVFASLTRGERRRKTIDWARLKKELASRQTGSIVQRQARSEAGEGKNKGVPIFSCVRGKRDGRKR